MKRRIATVIHVAIVMFGTVLAAQTETPQQLVHRGIELRQGGHDEESIELFHRAWETGHQPIALAQWGLAEQAVGRWAAAEAHLREARQEHADDEWVQRQRAALDRAYAVIQQHLGQLEVRGGVDGAEVTVNGAMAGTMPLAAPIYVEAGSAILVVTASGFDPVRRDVHVLAGQLNRELVEMQRSGSLSASPSISLASGASTEVRHGVPGVAIIIMIVGAVGVAVGATLFAVDISDSNSCQAGCAPGSSAASGAETAQGVVYAGDAAMIAGGVIATAGLAWLVIDALSSRPRRPSHASNDQVVGWRF